MDSGLGQFSKVKESVHIRGQILVELGKQCFDKLSGLLKDYIRDGCPLDQTGLFMGCTSVCKFVAGIPSSVDEAVSGVPKLVELGFFQTFLSIVSGNTGRIKKKSIRKVQLH